MIVPESIWRLLPGSLLMTIIVMVLWLRWDWVMRVWGWAARGLKSSARQIIWFQRTRRLSRAINTAVLQLFPASAEFWPMAVTLRLQRDTTDFSREHKGKLILPIKLGATQAETVAVATLTYVQEAFLLHLRAYCDTHLLAALEMMLAETILLVAKEQRAADYLRRSLAEPALANPQVSQLKESVEIIQHEGLLAYILLPELNRLHLRLGEEKLVSPEVRRDTLLFTIYLGQTLREWPAVPCCYDGRYIKAAFYFLASEKPLAAEAVELYRAHLTDTKAARGVASFYLLSRGNPAVKVVRQLSQWLKEQGMAVCEYRPLPPHGPSGGERLEVVACQCQRPSSSSPANLKELRQLAFDLLPICPDERLALEGLARVPGVTSLVVWRNLATAEAGVGKGEVWARYRQQLEHTLGEEVRVAWWRHNPRSFVLELFEDQPGKVAEVRANEEERLITLVLNNAVTRYRLLADPAFLEAVAKVTAHRIVLYSRAGQSRQWNLAEIGYHLAVFLPGLATQQLDLAGFAHDDPLLKIAIEPDGASTKPAGSPWLPAEQVARFCQESGFQEVHLIDFCEAPEGLVAALHPLQAEEIVDINWQETARAAVVTVNSEAAVARGLGPNGRNVALASELLSCSIEIVAQSSTPHGSFGARFATNKV
jgi:transcription antitermination factor NusA-like protein